MDQDMPHRISAPAKGTAGPRYSLVWKLVFFPREQQQQGEEEEEEEEGEGVFLSRPEWGEPIRFGSARAQQGVQAFQQQPGAA
jgi:probable phosphoglycerate mutase